MINKVDTTFLYLGRELEGDNLLFFLSAWSLYFNVMQEAFLYDLSALEPELCITAAYGNILPTKFLKIPSLGYCSFISILVFVKDLMI